MTQKIFVNFPVKDLKKSMAFFTQVGYEFNRQFTDETAACMVVSDDIYAMLLTEPKFQGFIPGAICDTTTASEVLICLSAESRQAVDERVERALAAGGTAFNQPVDYGFMYSRTFQDLDGHLWTILYMDPSVVQRQ